MRREFPAAKVVCSAEAEPPAECRESGIPAQRRDLRFDEQPAHAVWLADRRTLQGVESALAVAEGRGDDCETEGVSFPLGGESFCVRTSPAADIREREVRHSRLQQRECLLSPARQGQGSCKKRVDAHALEGRNGIRVLPGEQLHLADLPLHVQGQRIAAQCLLQ